MKASNTKRVVILVDVDGTVALRRGRKPYDESKVSNDAPNRPVIAAVRAMVSAGFHPVYVSGRSEACRQDTEVWLDYHVTSKPELHMRTIGDVRKDSVVKRQLFDTHIRDRYIVECVFDDRRQTVDMWRSIGLVVFQVDVGDF